MVCKANADRPLCELAWRHIEEVETEHGNAGESQAGLGLLTQSDIADQGARAGMVAAQPRFDRDSGRKMAFSWAAGRQISPGPLPQYRNWYK